MGQAQLLPKKKKGTMCKNIFRHSDVGFARDNKLKSLSHKNVRSTALIAGLPLPSEYVLQSYVADHLSFHPRCIKLQAEGFCTHS